MVPLDKFDLCRRLSRNWYRHEKELGVTDSGKVLLKTTHVWFGYVFAINLAWRLVWSFIGNRHARWSAILPFQNGYGTALKTYLRELIRGNVRPYLGHNRTTWQLLEPAFDLLSFLPSRARASKRSCSLWGRQAIFPTA